LADPTAAAYARVNQVGQPRSHQPYAILAPGLEDLVPNPSYTQRFDAWATIRDCYDGEATIKAAGEQYLPKLSAHKDPEYQTYKHRAYFYNAVRRTHRGLHGSLFRKPVEVLLPAPLKSKLDLGNITQDRQSFDAFVRILGHELLLTGRFGVLADFKSSSSDSPYLAGYLAENIYAWRLVTHLDREIVDRVVLLEQELTPTDYGFTSNLLIRILRLDPAPTSNGATQAPLVYSQTVLRPNASDTKAEPTTTNIPVSIRGRTLDYIPFVFMNAMDLRAECGPPPLEDIATINVSHYQSTAHLEHGRFYAGMPTYVTAGSAHNAMPGMPDGMTNTSPLTVGPSFVWELEENAKAWLLEFTGHGLTFLENAVDSKQLQMQSLGGRLISSTRRAAAMSDEAWQLLETGDEATLMDVANVCDEGVAQALAYLGDILGAIPPEKVHKPKEAGILVEFNKEFVRSELTARELRALQALAERGHIPQDVMYYALREVGVVPIEYSLDDFRKLLAKEGQKWEPPPPPPLPAGATPPTPTGVPGVRPRVAPSPNNPKPPE
jgi:hypothetical protein